MTNDESGNLRLTIYGLRKEEWRKMNYEWRMTNDEFTIEELPETSNQ